MKQKKFYRFILKDNKKLGVLYAPEGVDTKFGQSGVPMVNWDGVVFTLKDGIYTPFINSNVYATFVNDELKNLIKEVIPINYPLEFFPIQVKSEEYGDRLYYLIHFKIIFDVIDMENSVFIPGFAQDSSAIIKPWIDYKKAKDLDFFNSVARPDGIIVSDKMKSLMKKRKLDIGIEFLKVPYIE